MRLFVIRRLREIIGENHEKFRERILHYHLHYANEKTSMLDRLRSGVIENKALQHWPNFSSCNRRNKKTR